MLQFLNPIWLFGIGGIIIPLIIHLWNVKTGKTLKVGSIRLMGESARQNSRSLKLTDLLLLLLRCLMIILLSMLLAEPVWKTEAGKAKNKAWILAEKENLQEIYQVFKPEIDSLANSGAEFHFLEPEFKNAELTSALNDTSTTDTAQKLSYWSLIRLLENQKPPAIPAFVFTNDRLSRFHGSPTSIPPNIVWKTYTPSDSTSRWIDNAYLSSSGNISTSLFESSPRGTILTRIQLTPGAEERGINASIKEGMPIVQLDSQTLPADTTSIKIRVLEDGPTKNAEYVLAAIGAIQQYTARKITILNSSAPADILFWLSDKTIPEQVIKTMRPGSRIFTYAPGKELNSHSWLEVANAQTNIHSEPLTIYRRIAPPAAATDFALWEDGFGEPLLTLSSQNDLAYYTLYTRLDPEWTDLVWSAEFVKLLMPVIVPEQTVLKTEPDKRSIPDSRLTQSTLSGPNSPVRNTESPKIEAQSPQLDLFFWLLVMLLFISERWLSHRNNAI